MTPEQLQVLASSITTAFDEWTAAMRRAIPAYQAVMHAAADRWYIARPRAIRQQIGIYAKPTTKKIRKAIRALQSSVE